MGKKTKSNNSSFKPSSFEKKWPHTTLTSSRRLTASRSRGASVRDKQAFKPSSFEKKWQEIWEKYRVYQPDLKNAERPFYNLMMFPYPSAEGLHVGNMYAFTGADIYGRFMRMKGFDVFEPIGLDGFGIHSENYAIKIGKHPKAQAKISERNFYRQLHAIGNGFAWENTLETYDPDYYRWTQWIFVQMFKNGLAYRKKSLVNFCPSCKTVLADEQVVNEACERCKCVVSKKEMKQWFFRITRYAEKLLQNTYKKSFQWTEKVKKGQRNWIGKKEGINIKYQVSGMKYQVECFTTRPDTNFGATFVVVAPEHPFVALLLDSKFRASQPAGKIQNSKLKEVKEYVEKAKKKSNIERIAEGRKKTGVFTGLYCINQLNNYKMPIFISDFVLMEFGTGAVVGVPAHDKRDYEFAKEFDLEIKVVVLPERNSKFKIQDSKLQFKTQDKSIEGAYEGDGIVINSKFLNGLATSEAIGKMMDYIEKKGWGKKATTYKLRDWCISRQRYWGAPIPMIFCHKCASEEKSWFTTEEAKLLVQNQKPTPIESESKTKNQKENENLELEIRNFATEAAGWYPVSEEELPVLLPDISDWKPEGTGKGPLAKVESFVKVKCPQCNSSAERETDVCDTFLDSSWYFLRYPNVGYQKLKIKDQKHRSKFKNTQYQQYQKPTIGATTSTPPRWSSQNSPWDRKITQRWLPVAQYIGGAEHTVLHLLYARFVTMALNDWGFVDFDEPFKKFYAHGLIIAEGAKMSKSRGNIIIPDEYIRKYGADTLRSYLMFLGPFDAGGDFRDTGIAGMYRFLARVWRLVAGFISDSGKTSRNLGGLRMRSSEVEKPNKSLTRLMHQKIKEVTEDIEKLHYNTAIAHIMEYVNEIQKSMPVGGQAKFKIIKTLLLLLAPFAPHMCEELWQQIQKSGKSASEVVLSLRHIPDGGGVKDGFCSIHLHPWPSYDPKYLAEEEVTIVVQVNGKLRDAIKVQSAKCKAQKKVEEVARKSGKLQRHIKGKTIKKTIFVPGKLINFVI